MAVDEEEEAREGGGNRFRKARIRRAAPTASGPTTAEARQPKPRGRGGGTSEPKVIEGSPRPVKEETTRGSRLDGDAPDRSSRPANSVARLREQDNSDRNLYGGGESVSRTRRTSEGDVDALYRDPD